jgi:hypothetical protein
MAKKAAAQNGRADLPVSQDARQRVSAWHNCVKVMLDQIFKLKNQIPFTINNQL